MTKYLLFILITFSFHIVVGQNVHEPLVIIKENFNTRNYLANDEYCLYTVQPKFLIKNYEFRASLIKKHRIKSIKFTEGESQTTDIFNEDGHLISGVQFVSNTTITTDYINSYNYEGYLLNKPLKLESRGKQEKFRYDSLGQLKSFIKVVKRDLQKPAMESECFYNYDNAGRLTEIEGVKKFTYDSIGRLKLIEEINEYGNRYSKSTSDERRKSVYANRQFKEYFYNSLGLVKRININHFDSLTFGNYWIDFEYNDLKQLIRITKYHASGDKWKVNDLQYSGQLLVSNRETMYSGTSDSVTISELKYHYSKGLITKMEKYWSNKKTERKLTKEVHFDYTFYE